MNKFSIIKEREYIEKNLVKKNLFYLENPDYHFYLLNNYYFKNLVKTKNDLKKFYPKDLKTFLETRKKRVKFELWWCANYEYSREDRQDVMIKSSEYIFYIISDNAITGIERFKASLFSREFHQQMKLIKEKYCISKRKLERIINYTKGHITHTKVESSSTDFDGLKIA